MILVWIRNCLRKSYAGIWPFLEIHTLKCLLEYVITPNSTNFEIIIQIVTKSLIFQLVQFFINQTLATFLQGSKYAQKSSNWAIFVMKILACWARINFGWKLSQQFWVISLIKKFVFLLYFFSLGGLWSLEACGF